MNQQPQQFELYQNFPNPLNSTTTIKYNLKNSGHVLIKIYDLHRQEVTTLIYKEQTAGKHLLRWNASNFSSGIYFYSLHVGAFTEIKKTCLQTIA